MIKFTTWRPDTCECEFEYEWDDAEAEDNRTHTLKRVIKQCESHNGLIIGGNVYENVLKENQTKNKALGEFMEKVPRLKKQVMNEDGTNSFKLNPSIKYVWEFTGKDDKRELNIKFEGTNFSLIEKDLVDLSKFDKKVNLS